MAVPLTLVTGPANSGKAEVVLGAVRGHLAHGRDPWLVVPRLADSDAYLRELSADGVAMGVRVVRFGTLMDEAVRRAGVSARALGVLGRERVIAAAASTAEREPSASFLAATADLFAELRSRRVAPARFQQAVNAWSDADPAARGVDQLARLYGRYDERLKRLGLTDAEQRAVMALDELRRRPAAWGATPVLFYGFDDLTPLQLDAIETFAVVLDVDVVVSLTYEPGRAALAGRAASVESLRPRAREHRECAPRIEHYAPGAGAALSHLERSLFEDGTRRVDADGAVRLLEGGGPRAELELVATEVRRLLDEGMAAEEVAVVSREAPRGGDLIEDVFAKAGVPIALERRASFAGSAIGRALLGLLRCVPDAEGKVVGELGDLLAWLRCPGLLKGAPDTASLADRLELWARQRGIRGAAEARAAWEERNWPLEAIDRLHEAQRAGPPALLQRVDRELFALYRLPRRDAAAILDVRDRDEARALAAARRALSELRELARVERALAPASAAELADVLERAELYVGERPRAGAVAVLDPLALRARRVRALFLTGMTEGSFPARPGGRGLLSEDQRRGLAVASGLMLGEAQDSLAAERYLLYALVSRPQELLVLSWHLTDDEGEPVSRSLFVDDVCDLFDARLGEQVERRRLGALDVVPVAVERPAAPPAAAALRDERLLEQLRERIWSASAIESYIECPVRWFVQRLLDPELLEPEPEPFARGGVAHAALNDTLEGLRERTGSARVRPGNLELARELLGASLEHREAQRALSVSPERRLAGGRRLRAELERYLQHAANAEDLLEVEHLELGFGFSGEDDRGEASELGPLDLGDGLRLRGRIDRVDRGPAGEAVVIDYKASKAPPRARWIKDGRLQVALYMRAVEQLLGAPVVAGLYQPLSGKDLRARGAVDGDSAIGLDAVGTDVIDPDEFSALVDDAVREARSAVARARRGELTPRPESCSGGYGCAYPTICRCER
ncbi:MAG TPA: PD-(D/E)XK nuclease family protein [Solirubrobacteraceae bacterium]|jgi:ATP-dependent helicase/DNAse subunit B